MSLRRCVLSALICSSMVGMPGPVSSWAQEVPAETTGPAEVVEQILEVGKVTYKTGQEKENAFNKVQAIVVTDQSDPRVPFAKLLVAAELKKNTAASAASGEIVSRVPTYLPARVIKSRQLLSSSKLTQAAVEIETILEQLREPTQKYVSHDQRIAAAQFAGLAVAYLEGPASSQFKATGLKAILEDAELLPTDLKAAFEEQRALTLEEHRTITENGEAALDDLRNKKYEEERSNAELRKQLEAQRQQVQQDAEAVRKQLQDQWTQLNSQYQDIYSRLNTLSQNALLLQNQFGRLQAQYGLLIPPVPDNQGNIDQTALSIYLNQRAQMEGSLRQLQTEINQNQIQFQQQRSMGATIEGRLNQIQAESQRLGMNLQRQTQSLSQLDREIRGRESKIKKDEPKKSNSTLRLERAFSTYDDFNYFREAKLLLESFG